MTMYYVHGITPKRDVHINIPAVDNQNAFDLFKQELGKETTVVQISPLFQFDWEPAPTVVGVN